MACFDQSFDEFYQLYFLIKRPAPEEGYYKIDLRKVFPSEILNVVAYSQKLVTDTDNLVFATLDQHLIDASAVLLYASGGTDQEDYVVDLTVKDINENILVESFIIKVRKAGRVIRN